MKFIVLATTLAVAATAGLAAPAARAGTPFTIGEGKDPHVLVDPASGTGHVVWSDEIGDRVRFCQVPRGATACATTVELNPGFDPDASFLLRDASGLYIVMPHYVAGKTYLWKSGDGGATWGAMQQIYDQPNTTDATEPILGPQAGETTIASWNPGREVFAAKLDGSESASTARAELPAGGVGSLVYDLAVAPTTDNGLVGVANNLDKLFFWRMNPALDPSAAGNWSAAPTEIGAGEDSRVAGGSSGTFLLSALEGSGIPSQTEIRKWTGSGFGAPVVVAAERPYINDIAVGPSGAVAAIWRKNESSLDDRLRFALSTDGGASFGLSTIAFEDVVMASMDVSIASDNHGFAVYLGGAVDGSGAKNHIRMASTDPLPDPVVAPPPGGGSGGGGAPATPSTALPPRIYAGPTKRKTATGGGAKYTFTVPRSCIPAGTPFRVRLTWRKQKRKGNKFVKVTRSDFYIGKRRMKIDRKAPFTQTLLIRSPRRGATYTVKARAFIKVKRGKQPKKSIATKIKVCA